MGDQITHSPGFPHVSPPPTRCLPTMAPPPPIQVSIPSFFRCPISLDLMRDPVSLCNGMTYDRSSIEAWFDRGNRTCPATMQVLQNLSLVPNHTLRRLIQAWCVSNRSLGVERIPTPQTPADASKVQRLLQDITLENSALDVLKKLRRLANESIRNALCIAENGAPAVLVAFLASKCSDAQKNKDDNMEICQEALFVLSSLPLSDQSRKTVASPANLGAFAFLLSKGDSAGRANVATLVDRLAADEETRTDIGAAQGMIAGLVSLFSESSGAKAERICLKALYELNLSRKNRVETVKTGVMELIIERLPEASKGVTEASLAVVEVLCRCAEGRAAMKEHGLGIPVVVKKLLGVSDVATEHAMGALWSVCKYSEDEGARREAAWAGVCSKLCLLLQVDSTPRARNEATKLLRLLHAASSTDCPCCYQPFVL